MSIQVGQNRSQVRFDITFSPPGQSHGLCLPGKRLMRVTLKLIACREDEFQDSVPWQSRCPVRQCFRYVPLEVESPISHPLHLVVNAKSQLFVILSHTQVTTPSLDTVSSPLDARHVS